MNELLSLPLVAQALMGFAVVLLLANIVQWRRARSLKQETLNALETKAELETKLEVVENSYQTRIDDLQGMRKDVEDRFAALAGNVINENSENLLKLVSERFKTHNETAQGDLNERQKAIANLVKPLDEKLGKFDKRINEIEKAREGAYFAIKQQVESLGTGQKELNSETRKLVQALRAPKTRGRWGELHLKKVFELAGMSEHVDFVLEETHDTDEGRKRPDAIIQIPGGKSIVVDAKTSTDAYLDALESGDAESEARHLQRHAAQIKDRIKELSSKSYQELLQETPDFVVMFIPGETFLSAAAEQDPGLFEFGFERKILIATPTTLIALVKAIAYGWQQEKMAENAATVQAAAKELYDRLTKFGDHLTRVGKSLNGSVKAYNDAVGSLEGRVLPSARKFESMGVVSDETEIAGPDLVELETRPISAPEYVSQNPKNKGGEA